LLEKLAIDKLERKAKKLRAEGWKWVGTATEISFETLRAFGRAQPKRKPLSDEQQEELDKLAAEQDALAAEGDEFDDETLEKLDGMSQRIDELSEGEPEWTDAIRANAGVVVTIGYNGEFRIERGLVKPEDKKAFVSVSKGQNEPSADESEPTDNTAAGYSSALVEDLTAQRTAALRALLKNNEAVALAAVAHAMALPLFYDIVPSAESCLALRIQNRDLRRSADGIVQSRAYDAVETAWTIWKEKLPLDETALFDWLLTQEQTIVTGLISFCAAMSIDAVRGKSDRSDNPRLTHADQLAKALSLDMAEWWTATKDTFLRRVPKKLVLAAVTEGVSAQAAENLASLKKEALVESAEQRLAGTGWLPPMLRKAA
jgi:ParB family chromosome partitioning protein